VEHRVYFAMPGLLLIVIDFLGRLRITRQTLSAVCGGILLLAAGATYARARVWGDTVSLWRDAVTKSPNKSRAHLQLAQAYVNAEQTSAAVAEYQKASELGPPSYGLLVDWGLALNSAGQSDQALAKLRQAAALNPTAHVYSQIGMVYAMRFEWNPALEALAVAEKLDPSFGGTFVYRGQIRLKQNDCKAAIPEFVRALQIDAHDSTAKRYLSMAQTCAKTHYEY
jgi:tetratricopeptide (TPR) repeat protein